jgi:hypothetical protein
VARLNGGDGLAQIVKVHGLRPYEGELISKMGK